MRNYPEHVYYFTYIFSPFLIGIPAKIQDHDQSVFVGVHRRMHGLLYTQRAETHISHPKHITFICKYSLHEVILSTRILKQRIVLRLHMRHMQPKLTKKAGRCCRWVTPLETMKLPTTIFRFSISVCKLLTGVLSYAQVCPSVQSHSKISLRATLQCCCVVRWRWAQRSTWSLNAAGHSIL